MGTNGVVRRIDELGRIVIPKEIRKSLNIKEGEMLEIIPNKENITINKYSMIKDIRNISNDLLKNIAKYTSNVCIITDLSNIVALENSDKFKVNDNITKELYNIIFSRNFIIKKGNDNFKLFENNNEEYYFKIIVPIILDSYVIGSIILLSNNNVSEGEINLIKFASSIISLSL